MRSINTLKNSTFLTRGDVAPPVAVTISHVADEKVGTDEEQKPVLYFRELGKGLVLNWTNAQCIAELLGTEDMDLWGGGKIVLFDDPRVEYAGKRCGGIRVRAAHAASAIGHNESIPY